jgi:hypothetical protein
LFSTWTFSKKNCGVFELHSDFWSAALTPLPVLKFVQLAGCPCFGVYNKFGVAMKELNIIKLMTEKAAKLDRETFGVDGAHGPWQRRLAEIGGIKPLAFGQFGEMGPGLEALLAPR